MFLLNFSFIGSCKLALKNPAPNLGGLGDQGAGFQPWVGRSGEWALAPVFFLWKFHGQGLVWTTVTEQLTIFLFQHIYINFSDLFIIRLFDIHVVVLFLLMVMNLFFICLLD